MSSLSKNWNRRRFVQTAGSLAALSAAKQVALAAAKRGVTIVVDPVDAVAGSPQITWAVSELERVLGAKQVAVLRATDSASAHAGDLCILVAGAASARANAILTKAGVQAPSGPEALSIVEGVAGSRKVLLASGSDVRGLMYAVLEIADRIELNPDAISALHFDQAFSEKPTNSVRSINRCFQSDLEDKPWFNDKAMWTAYLSMLASNRFNQFNLSWGLAYDYPQVVTDSYSYFTYPFFVSVPGYEQVKATGLSDAERDRNLELLRFIAAECERRGLNFTLGLWNHAYVMSKGSTPTYPIAGLTE